MLTVDRYLAQCEALKGRPVQLAGYLGECGGHDCRLFKDRGQAIGFAESFDRKAASFRNGNVVIAGRVRKDDCIGLGTDRSAGIDPSHIRAWTSSEGAPANTN